MIVAQLMKVLPAASDFKIYDFNKPVVEGKIAQSDKSVIISDVATFERFNRIYQGYHVELVDKVDGVFIINVR